MGDSDLYFGDSTGDVDAMLLGIKEEATLANVPHNVGRGVHEVVTAPTAEHMTSAAEALYLGATTVGAVTDFVPNPSTGSIMPHLEAEGLASVLVGVSDESHISLHGSDGAEAVPLDPALFLLSCLPGQYNRRRLLPTPKLLTYARSCW